MHRFGFDNYEFVKKSQGWANVSISVGVQESDRQSLLKMKNDKVYPDFITIDIAHGDSILMKEMIEFIKELNFPSEFFDFSNTNKTSKFNFEINSDNVDDVSQLIQVNQRNNPAFNP